MNFACIFQRQGFITFASHEAAEKAIAEVCIIAYYFSFSIPYHTSFSLSHFFTTSIVSPIFL